MEYVRDEQNKQNVEQGNASFLTYNILKEIGYLLPHSRLSGVMGSHSLQRLFVVVVFFFLFFFFCGPVSKLYAAGR